MARHQVSKVGIKFFGFVAIVMLACSSWAQPINGTDGSGFEKADKKHCDCDSAWYTEDAQFAPMSMPRGYGKKLEIRGNSIKNKYVPTKEHNSLWIRFKFLVDTDFEFQLSPSVPTDDFDFSIWKVNGENYCDSIRRGALPVRSNLARRNPDEGSVTGLKRGAGQDFAKAGPNPTFSNALAVSAGEEYIMLIDAPYGAAGGFSSEFEYDRNPPVVELDTVPEEPKIVYPQLFIKVIGEENKKIFAADLRIKNLPEEDSIYEFGGYYVVSRLRPHKSYIIDVEKRDYLQTTERYFADSAVSDTVEIVLEKLKIGTKLQFQNILFIPDQPTIMKSSYRDLKRIRNFLQLNPHISVEIAGHVNGLGRKKKKYRDLSERRARAIYDYLVEEGIDKDRMTYQGYGAEQLIYAHPKNESEARLNRRVEVKITKI